MRRSNFEKSFAAAFSQESHNKSRNGDIIVDWNENKRSRRFFWRLPLLVQQNDCSAEDRAVENTVSSSGSEINFYESSTRTENRLLLISNDFEDEPISMQDKLIREWKYEEDTKKQKNITCKRMKNETRLSILTACEKDYEKKQNPIKQTVSSLKKLVTSKISNVLRVSSVEAMRRSSVETLRRTSNSMSRRISMDENLSILFKDDKRFSVHDGWIDLCNEEK